MDITQLDRGEPVHVQPALSANINSNPMAVTIRNKTGPPGHRFYLDETKPVTTR